MKKTTTIMMFLAFLGLGLGITAMAVNRSFYINKDWSDYFNWLDEKRDEVVNKQLELEQSLLEPLLEELMRSVPTTQMTMDNFSNKLKRVLQKFGCRCEINIYPKQKQSYSKMSAPWLMKTPEQVLETQANFELSYFQSTSRVYRPDNYFDRLADYSLVIKPGYFSFHDKIFVKTADTAGSALLLNQKNNSFIYYSSFPIKSLDQTEEWNVVLTVQIPKAEFGYLAHQIEDVIDTDTGRLPSELTTANNESFRKYYDKRLDARQDSYRFFNKMTFDFGVLMNIQTPFLGGRGVWLFVPSVTPPPITRFAHHNEKENYWKIGISFVFYELTLFLIWLGLKRYSKP